MAKNEKKNLIDFSNNISQLDALKPFIEDKKTNFFEITNITNTEIRHSQILAWLLDPKGSHTYNQDFFKEFIKSAIIQARTELDFTQADIIYNDYSDLKVYTEVAVPSGRIDILLVSENNNFVVAIENKIDSTEHSNQLTNYEAYVNNVYRDYSKLLLYLTKDGEEPLNNPNWNIISHVDILNILSNLPQRENVKIGYLIEDYKNTLKEILNMNEELKQLCKNIYSQNKEAIDLIIQYKLDIKTEISEKINSLLEELKDDYELIRIKSTANYIRFTTQKMRNHFMQDGLKAWDHEVFCYEIHLYSDGKVDICMVIGPSRDNDGRKARIESSGLNALGCDYTKNVQYNKFNMADLITTEEIEESTIEQAIQGLRNYITSVVPQADDLISNNENI